MRLDKLLWFLRLAKSRGLAQEWAEAGHIRRNGRRVERSAQAVAVGDVLTVPMGARTIAIRVLTLPDRRGPVPEALACYQRLDAMPPKMADTMPEEMLDVPASSPLARPANELPEGKPAP